MDILRIDDSDGNEIINGMQKYCELWNLRIMFEEEEECSDIIRMEDMMLFDQLFEIDVKNIFDFCISLDGEVKGSKLVLVDFEFVREMILMVDNFFLNVVFRFYNLWYFCVLLIVLLLLLLLIFNVFILNFLKNFKFFKFLLFSCLILFVLLY